MVVLEEGATLYDALGVDRNASQAEIRKAYLRLAVTCHPDKHPDDDQAKERFQTLQKLYSILSDVDKRQVYDTTGSVDDAEQLSGQAFNELYAHYRGIFAKVTEEDVVNFEEEFRGSKEEAAEVLRYYSRFEGDMQQAFEWIMCSHPERDGHRFMDLIDEAIKEGQVMSYKRYKAWAKKLAAKPRPAQPLVPPKRTKVQSKSEHALVALIRSKHRSTFAGTLDAIAAKYGVAAGDAPACPTEEEFEAALSRLQQRGVTSKAGGKVSIRATGKAKASAGGSASRKKAKH